MSATSSAKTKTLSAIVCAYTDERWNDIVAALRSLQNQQPAVDQIILVIDHNDELFDKATQHFAGEKIEVVKNTNKNGLSGARNTGAEKATGDVIAFLDDDAEAMANWSSAILASFHNDEVVGVGGHVSARWRAPRPNWWPREFDWVVGCSYVGLPTTVSEIRNPIGANMAVRRDVLETVGGFSPAIGRVGKHPIGCEETELFIRIAQDARTYNRPAHVLFEPAVDVFHNVPAARANFKYFAQRCFAEGLSKAVVAKLVGSDDALSSERSYTTKTLPAGVLRGLRDAIGGNKFGLGRSAAIVAGLFITAAGYARGRMDKGDNLRIPKSAEQ